MTRTAPQTQTAAGFVFATPGTGRVGTQNVKRGTVILLDGREGVWMVLKREWVRASRTDDLVVTPFTGKIVSRARSGAESGQRIKNGVRKITGVAVARA